MKGSPLAVLLITSLVVLCTIKLSCGYKSELARWRSHRENIDRIVGRHHDRPRDRLRRQLSPNCSKAIEEYDSDDVQTCFDYFDDLSDEDLTNEDLRDYCDDDCSSKIISVSYDLAAYCRDGGGEPDQEIINKIRLMCTRNLYDDYCYVALENVYKDKSAPDESDCDPKDIPCSNICKQVAAYIDAKLGCCFATFKQYGLIDANYTIGFFELCGSVYIPAC